MLFYIIPNAIGGNLRLGFALECYIIVCVGAEFPLWRCFPQQRNDMEHAGGEIGATPDEKEPWWMMWNLRGQRQEIFL